MTPDARAARLHLADAADALRTASERLCDWLEATVGDINSAPNADTGCASSDAATGQDVAGNGHVASADEAAGSFRGAPTAPVSSSLAPISWSALVERSPIETAAELFGEDRVIVTEVRDDA